MSQLAQAETVTNTEVDLTCPQWNKPVVSHMSCTLKEYPSRQKSLFDIKPFRSKEQIFDVNFTEIMATKIDASFKSMKLQNDPCQISLIGEDIWIGGNCESSGVFYIFDTSNETIEECSLQHDTGVRTFCQVSDKRLIAACETGLVVLTMNGDFVLKFSEDQFKDISTQTGKLFAIEARSHNLCIYELQNGMWTYIQEISMDYHFSCDDTMLTDQNCLYICVKGLSKILKYSLEGELINEFGSKGTEPGEFHMPSVCGIDKYGNLIVCDSQNHRIQVMITNHTWLMYPLSEIKFPSDLLVHNDFVYILAGKKQNRKLLWKKCQSHQ